MKKAFDLVKNNNRGMSLLIMLMMIAVFSVFIIGTYGILNSHIIRTIYSEDEQGAYYAAESVLKLSSTQIDRLAYDISNEYNAREQVLTKAQFITELDARVASSQDIFLSAVQDEFSEYHVNSVYVVPNPTESAKYTRLYDITAYISNDRQVDKKVTGTYGVLYLTESSSSESTSVMIINESTPMLTALENVTAAESCSLNGNAILKGTFSYAGHYNATTDPLHFYNNGHTYDVDTSSLVRSNVKIPTIPDAPYEGDPETIQYPSIVGPPAENSNICTGITPTPTPTPMYTYTHDQPRSFDIKQTIDIPYWGHPWWPEDSWIVKGDYNLGGNSIYVTNKSLTINANTNNSSYGINEDLDCALFCANIEINNDLIINVDKRDFKIKLTNDIICKKNGKIIINTNGYDVFIRASNLRMDEDVDSINIITTGSGNVYFFFNSFLQQYTFGNFNDRYLNINVTNEGNVHMIINGGHLSVGWGGTYSNIIFNCYVPDGKAEAGIVNFFVAQVEFGVTALGTITFNAKDGTHLNFIADKLVMNGNLKILGTATVNIYARQSCTFNGKDPTGPDSEYPEPKYLSNYPFTDAGMTENEKASKIIDTKLNIYYYGSDALQISNYMCCANFYSAKDADIIINNSSFYGNIFSSAPAPEEGKARYKIDFNNSYISCGAIYAPRMDINISGDQNYPYKRITDEGTFSSCVFAAATGYNIKFTGLSMIKSSDIVTQSMELIVELEFTPGVVAVGDSYTGSHFSRGFTIE